nr:MAG TPA: hypothetical protein [Bacteriophage sp.]
MLTLVKNLRSEIKIYSRPAILPGGYLKGKIK